jgi:hypothetical protein
MTKKIAARPLGMILGERIFGLDDGLVVTEAE